MDGPAAYVHVDHVRFSDLDARGHLNNVAFLQFFEGARNAYLKAIYPPHDPTENSEADLIVAHLEIDYRAPGHLGEEIRTHVRPVEVEEKKLVLEFAMRGGEDDRLLAEGRGVSVGYDYERGEPRSLPEGLAAALDGAPEGLGQAAT